MALPRPRPERGEVLIRVVAAGVNPLDCHVREGRLKDQIPHRFPLIPGWDVAGVVEELGEGASSVRKGERVWGYGRKPTIQWGCYAEYVALPENNIALMPVKLLFEEAAAVPLAALAARQCLFGKPGLERDGTVLVHAAAGGVGHFAVQLAKLAGVRAFGTAGSEKQSFVLGLGAEAVINYEKEDFAEALKRHAPEGADLVIDSVGGATLNRSFDAVKPGGRLVSLLTQPDPVKAADRGITAHFQFTEPNADQLREFARLFDTKKLRTHVQKIYSLSEAAQAQQEIESGHVQGKLVLNL